MGVGLFGPPVPGAPWSALAKAPTGTESQGVPAPRPPTPGTGQNRPYVPRVPRTVGQALTKGLSARDQSSVFSEQRRNARHSEIVSEAFNSLIAQGVLVKGLSGKWTLNVGATQSIPDPTGQPGKFLESNGTAYALAYAPTFAAGLYVPALNPVNSSAMAWVNQQSSSFQDATGSFLVNNAGVDVGSGGADSLSALVQTAPSTPYTAKALFRSATTGTFLAHYGVIARNSGSGKLLAMNVLDNGSGGAFIRASKWNVPGTFQGNYKFTSTGTALFPPADVWLALQDDGTNLKFLVSADGMNWITYTSQLRGDFAIPDQIGFYACVSTTQQSWALQVLSFTVG